MNSFKIRKAGPDDLDTIYLFEHAYILTHERAQLERWNSAKKRIMTTLENSLGRMFVAAVGGVPAGHVYWAMNNGAPCIYSVYVCESDRRRGIASALMRAAEQQITERGESEITLSTLVTNPARHLFEKMNYTVVKVEDGWNHYRKMI